MKKRFFSLLMLVFVVFMLSGCSFSLFFNSGNNESIYQNAITIDASKSLDERVQQIAKDYVSAIVTVFVVDANNNEVAFGSGVGVYEGGYIVTNYHVISQVVGSNSYSLAVYYNQSQTPHAAEVLWSHPNLDLALIKAEDPNLPFVNMADRFIFPQVGNALVALETVVAIGTPIDFSLQNTITLGYIASANHRIAYSDGNIYENLIQHTAPINHGNSGGALFDSYGKLIGLNTLGNDDANSIFFSVPIYPLMLILDDIVAAYEANETFVTPILGIKGLDRFQAEYSNVDFDEAGMKVTEVPADGPSHNKLVADDVIKSITIGSTVFQINIRNDLLYALLKAGSGQTVSVSYVRGNVSGSVNITLG